MTAQTALTCLQQNFNGCAPGLYQNKDDSPVSLGQIGAGIGAGLTAIMASGVAVPLVRRFIGDKGVTGAFGTAAGLALGAAAGYAMYEGALNTDMIGDAASWLAQEASWEGVLKCGFAVLAMGVPDAIFSSFGMNSTLAAGLALATALFIADAGWNYAGEVMDGRGIVHNPMDAMGKTVGTIAETGQWALDAGRDMLQPPRVPAGPSP